MQTSDDGILMRPEWAAYSKVPIFLRIVAAYGRDPFAHDLVVCERAECVRMDGNPDPNKLRALRHYAERLGLLTRTTGVDHRGDTINGWRPVEPRRKEAA